MKKLILILALVAFVGVGCVAETQQPLTNKEIVNTMKYCQDRGFNRVTLLRNDAREVYRVECRD